jgi:hypothetical protein
MIRRCVDPENKSYPRYGGRGVTVCDRWRNSFEAFIEDMGERPDGHQLDRKDPNGNYEPGNCRWTTDSAASTDVAAVRNRELMEEFRKMPSATKQDRMRTIKALAKSYGITTSAIRAIVWRYGSSPQGHGGSPSG